MTDWDELISRSQAHGDQAMARLRDSRQAQGAMEAFVRALFGLTFELRGAGFSADDAASFVGGAFLTAFGQAQRSYDGLGGGA